MSQVIDKELEKLTLVMPPEVKAPLDDLEESDDPLEDLMHEFTEHEVPQSAERVLMSIPEQVAATHKDDQMWVVLEDQLGGLREGLKRLNYYLTEVDEGIRR